MAIHNEGKILEKTLNHLSKINYPNYEVIIGLDGCTDNSEKIVKKFVKKNPKIFRYFMLNERKGKPAVINKIIKKAKGEIILINDADWLFTSKYNDGIKKMMEIFDDSKIGGIADGFPIEWDLNKIKKGNLGYRMVAYSSYFWIEFQKKNFAIEKNKLLYLKEPAMFLTNIFRKKLYKENSLLGDDFERTKDIMDQGYKIVCFDDLNMLRIVASYEKILILDLFKQKIRTAIARRQLKEINEKINFTSYYFPMIFYMMKESIKKGLSVFCMIIFWIFLTTFASFVAKFKRIGTKEGWKLRMRR